MTIGFSPCPNDTFIFDALVNKKIDTGGLNFEPVLEDVETLNQWALEGRLDITKLSFPAFFQSTDKYILLNSGSALGKGVGPLLVSNAPLTVQELSEATTVVLPGMNTTANLLFSFAFPSVNKKVFVRYNEIEDFVLKHSMPGVIIHENRFTYQQKGLYKIADLGEYWEQQMNAPIPLGGIVISKKIDRQKSQQVDQLIRKSLEYAFANYPLVTDYVKQHSQTMSEDVMRKHIDLYVNNFSLDLGPEGKKAIETLHGVFIGQQPGDKYEASSSQLFLS